ncbi:MAG: ANTAR domain-containing protein [Erysipelotrichia bacterium]|nr:ANTAR domain-containing protein [Erysipelotrichia bacterium]NCC54117.1 ANTAR domain-containing protein [Erysipelotrichia bacterium]
MSNCLIVSSLQKSLEALTQLLKNNNITTVSCVKSGSEARRLLADKKFALVLINTPLSDEFGHDLAYTISRNSDSGVVMLVKNEVLDEMSHKLFEYGAMCIGKPLDRMLFQQGIRLALSSHYRVVGLQKENIKLQEKMEEIRLINRAKYALMDYLNMSEGQAHHYIEKRAMDQRKNKLSIAMEILKTYE